MNTFHLHQLFTQQICLLPEKCLFWPANGMLIIADVHLGKVMHFRKAGIPIPTAIIQRDIQLLQQLLNTYLPKRVVFLGDLFHSSLNSEWHLFEALTNKFPNTQFELVLGNHDAYTADFMREQLIVYQEQLIVEPFLLTHIPLVAHEIPEHLYNLSGHLHPAVKLKGKGRQQLQFPCFFFGEKQGILPAFGGFTGYVSMKVTAQDRVFPVIEGKVMDISF